MNRQDNIDIIVKRVALLALFLLFLFVFKNTNGTHDSIGKITATEQIAIAGNSAIINAPVTFNNTPANVERPSFEPSGNDIFKIICSNSEVNHRLRIGKERFMKIKPHIFNINLYHNGTPLHNGETSLIS